MVIPALGRLPAPTEFAGTQAAVERFGSVKRAFAVIRRITDAESWEAIARRRREDMLVYLALARFGKRPKLSQPPLTLQRDMKAFFGAAAASRQNLYRNIGESGQTSIVAQESVEAMLQGQRQVQGVGQTVVVPCPNHGGTVMHARGDENRGQVRANEKPLIIQQQRPIGCAQGPDEAFGPGQVTGNKTMPGEFQSGDVIARPLLKRRLSFNREDGNVRIEVVEHHQLPPAEEPELVWHRAASILCSYSASPSCRVASIS